MGPPQDLGNALKALMILATVGLFAFFGMVISCILLIISIFTVLPFHPFWGFIVVPIGIVISCLFSRMWRG